MRIAVYCSANNQIDPDYFRLTRELGEWLGREGHTLVFGGVNMGLMECVAQAARGAGATVVGVVPTIIEQNGRTSEHLDVEVRCDNLSDRKDLMLAKSDVAIALPGGVGTLDEVFGMLASASIGYHRKRVVLYNMKGFWNPLLDMLKALAAQGVIRRSLDEHLLVANSLDELTELLREK